MTNSLKSAGLAALSFTISAGVLAVALVPATASASGMTTDFRVVAQLDRDVLTTRVAINDLDLTRDADLRTLDARLHSASVYVCRSSDGERISAAEARCRIDAKASADIQVAGLREKARALAAAGQPVTIVSSIVLAAR